MIDEAEFERRVEHWFGLVMASLEENVGRAINESSEIFNADSDNPAFLLAMEEADLYRALYLPEEILAHYLDPIMPQGYRDKAGRADFLLQQAIMQKSAHLLTAQTIEAARER